MNTSKPSPAANRRLIGRLALVVVAMFGFGYALVPIYRVFCDITGLNGKTGRLETAEALSREVDEHRLVTVEFTGSVNSGLPWRLEPVVKRIRVHPGQLTEVDFYAENLSAHERLGQAVPSVAPAEASKYFFKTECFCFTSQTLAGGEGRTMPVRFVIDARLPDHIRTLTLSYTFFGAAAGWKAKPG